MWTVTHNITSIRTTWVYTRFTLSVLIIHHSIKNHFMQQYKKITSFPVGFKFQTVK